MSYGLDRAETARRVSNLDNVALGQLADIVIQESNRRGMSREAKIAGYTGLANFALGVARALACRATLRASKGHVPFAVLVSPHLAGGTPTAGAMWTAADGVGASFQPQAQCLNPRVDARAWRDMVANNGSQLLRWGTKNGRPYGGIGPL